MSKKFDLGSIGFTGVNDQLVAVSFVKEGTVLCLDRDVFRFIAKICREKLAVAETALCNVHVLNAGGVNNVRIASAKGDAFDICISEACLETGAASIRALFTKEDVKTFVAALEEEFGEDPFDIDFAKVAVVLDAKDAWDLI